MPSYRTLVSSSVQLTASPSTSLASSSRFTVSSRRLPAPLLALCAALIALAPAAGASARTGPAAAPLPLTVVQTSDTALTLDSGSPATAGPGAMYVHYRITNTSGASIPDLSATLSGFGGGIALAGGQRATQYVGTLAAGASHSVFWFLGYPSTYGTRAVLSVTVTDGTGGTASGSAPVRTVSMASAQAGGATTTAAIGAGGVLGQLIPLDVTFQFRSWKVGDTFNLQPAGNVAFPAGCFQLMQTVVTAVDAPLNQVIVPGTADQTFFVAGVASGGSGSPWNVSIRYTFRYLCSGTTATPLPYSNHPSGAQFRYSLNYAAAAGTPNPFPAAPSPSASFTFTKTAATIQLPNGGAETYTVTVRNISTFDVTIDSIVDVLPAGVKFDSLTTASGVTAANSAAMPASGVTGRLVWRGTPGTSYAIAAGTTLNLVYATTIITTSGQYVNAAGGYVGSTTIGTGAATVTVGTADLAIYKAGPATRAMQDTVKYAVTVRNAGPGTAFQVVVRDTLPAGTTFVRATRSGTHAAGVVTWPALASLAAGASVVDSVLILAPNTLTTLVNRAAAASASYDPLAANNDGSADSSRVSTTLTVAVSVSPKGLGAPVKQLPTAGTTTSQPFTVANVSVFNASYRLVAAVAGAPAFLRVDSITGPGITSRVLPDTAVVAVAANSSAIYRVWHAIPAGDTLTNIQVLRAQHLTQSLTRDTGWVQIKRVFPTLAISKTVSPTGTVSPGVDLTYTMKFNNTGEYDASTVVVSDEIPGAVVFKLGSATQVLPSGVGATVTYSKDGGATWTYTPVSGGNGAPAGYDAFVNHIRWTLDALLPPSPTRSEVAFVAQIK